jgi:hypothetical protein
LHSISSGSGELDDDESEPDGYEPDEEDEEDKTSNASESDGGYEDRLAYKEYMVIEDGEEDEEEEGPVVSMCRFFIFYLYLLTTHRKSVQS